MLCYKQLTEVLEVDDIYSLNVHVYIKIFASGYRPGTQN